MINTFLAITGMYLLKIEYILQLYLRLNFQDGKKQINIPSRIQRVKKFTQLLKVKFIKLKLEDCIIFLKESGTCMRLCCKQNRGFIIHIVDNMNHVCHFETWIIIRF